MNYSELLALSDQVKTETVADQNTALRIGTLFEEIVKYLRDQSGWAVYQDTEYNSANPFFLTEAQGVVTLPNNAGIKIESQKPTFLTTFYDALTAKITGLNGMGLNVLVEYTCRTPSNATGIRITNTIDIGGTIGKLYPNDVNLVKGSGIDNYFLRSAAGYTLGTWESNGGIPQVQAFGASVEIFDIRYVFTLTHKPIL